MQTFFSYGLRFVRHEGLALLAVLLAAVLLPLLAYGLLPQRAMLSAAWPATALPQQGFHQVERMGADERGSAFRWSEGDALLTLPNPGGPVLLRLSLAAPPTGRTAPLELSTSLQALPAFTVTDSPRRYNLLLAPDPLAERVRLYFETATFREELGRRKERRLGVMVAELVVDTAQGGHPPYALLLALLTASATGYLLLRRIGLRPALAVAALLVALSALSLLQALWAWRWALTGRLLVGLSAAGLFAVMVDTLLQRTRFASPALVACTQTHPTLPRNLRTLCVLAVVLVLALAVRIAWIAAPDPVGDLELSARRTAALATQGLDGAYGGSGGNDYLPLRLYLLWGLGSLARLVGIPLATPLSPTASLLLKLPWLLADLVTVVLVFGFAHRQLTLLQAATLAMLYALLPPIWLNPAWWGQIDALLVLLMLGAVLALRRADALVAWIVLSLALLVKFQAIILLPLVALLTLRRHGLSGLLAGVGCAAAILVFGMLPLVLAGHTPDLLEAYLGSVGRFNGVTINAYNIWYIVAPGIYVPDTEPFILGLNYRQTGLLLLGAASLVIGALAVRANRPEADLEAAALQALAFFMLPTQIHERYLFLCLVFLTLQVPQHPQRLLPLLVLSVSASFNIFGTLDFWPALRSWIGTPAVGMTFIAINLAVFGTLLWSFAQRVTQYVTQPKSYRREEGQNR